MIGFASILDKVIIVKDRVGLAHLLEWEFNGIGNLERDYGYLLKVSQEITEFNNYE